MLTDGDGGTSAPATRDITVGAVNDPPILTTTAGSLGHVEGDGPEAIDTGLTLADVDSPNIAGATVQVTGNYASGQDVLAAVAPLFGVTPGFDPATGTLTLTGATTIANYQTILRAVTYENTSQAPSTLDRTVTFTVNDGGLDSAGATKGITVTGVDDAPTVTASAGNTPYTEQAAAVAVDSALQVADVDGGANPTGATVTIVSPVAGDTLSFTTQNNITGNFAAGVLTLSGTATPAQYEQALRSVGFANPTSDTPGTTRSIQFKITTPIASNTATKTIAITEVNDPPVVNLDAPGTLSYTEQSGFTNLFGPAATVTDPDSATLDSLTVTITSRLRRRPSTSCGSTRRSPGSRSRRARARSRSPAPAARRRSSRRRCARSSSATPTTTPTTATTAPPNPSTADRTVSVVADDGPATSSPVTRNVTITPVNDAPQRADARHRAPTACATPRWSPAPTRSPTRRSPARSTSRATRPTRTAWSPRSPSSRRRPPRPPRAAGSR